MNNKLKISPHSLEAEQSILGGIIINNFCWEKISEILLSKDFYNYQHKIIFNEIKKLFKEGLPVDILTLSESLNNKKLLSKVGGFSYLAQIIENTPSAANVISYAYIIRERAVLRDLIQVANKIADASYNPNGRKINDLLDYSESIVFQISKNRFNRNNPININDILKKTIKRIKFMRDNPNNGLTGLNTGYQDLNNKTYGLQNSDLIIIAGRPSMGKTTFAMNICENVSMLYNKPILIFSLEMPSYQIIIKMLSSYSRIEQSKIRTGQLNTNEWKKLSYTLNLMSKRNNIYIDDTTNLTPSELRSKARRIYKENNGLSLIMIDYLQLMKINSNNDNRNLEIAEITRSLKSLAKELDIPIIALSQLNRYLEQRADKRPINSDLRESGAIEQDADLIMFIYRDEIYNKNSKMKGIAEIIISKHRNGPLGKILLTFNSLFSRFDNYNSKPFYYEIVNNNLKNNLINT